MAKEQIEASEQRMLWRPEHPIHRVLMHSREFSRVFGDIDEILHEYPVLMELNRSAETTEAELWSNLRLDRVVSERHDIARALLTFEKKGLVSISGQTKPKPRPYISATATIKRTGVLESKLREHARRYCPFVMDVAPPESWEENGKWTEFNNLVFEFYRIDHWATWQSALRELAGNNQKLFATLKGAPHWLAIHVLFYNRHDFMPNDLLMIETLFGLGLSHEHFESVFNLLRQHKVIQPVNGRLVLSERASRAADAYEDLLKDKFSALADKCRPLLG